MLGPAQFSLQIVKRIHAPFDDHNWLFEIKHDGFRMLAIRDGGPTRLFTKQGYDISRQHRHITEQLDALPTDRFVVDGELVVLDDDGRSNFAKLMHLRTGTHYYVFDLLMLGAVDLRPWPLEKRKDALKNLFAAGDPEPVRYCDHVPGAGKAFFGAVRQAGLEGMVAKRRRSSYLGCLTEDWLKVKCMRTHYFLVGGWVPYGDRPFGGLLLGEFVDGDLRYVGKVGSEFDARILAYIGRKLTPRTNSPFDDPIPEPDAQFCQPTLRAAVEFLDLTQDGYLRYPGFKRFADDYPEPSARRRSRLTSLA